MCAIHVCVSKSRCLLGGEVQIPNRKQDCWVACLLCALSWPPSAALCLRAMTTHPTINPITPVKEAAQCSSPTGTCLSAPPPAQPTMLGMCFKPSPTPWPTAAYAKGSPRCLTPKGHLWIRVCPDRHILTHTQGSVGLFSCWPCVAEVNRHGSCWQ